MPRPTPPPSRCIHHGAPTGACNDVDGEVGATTDPAAETAVGGLGTTRPRRLAASQKGIQREVPVPNTTNAKRARGSNNTAAAESDGRGERGAWFVCC